MDILLIQTQDRTQIQPKSIHGMLWLQTHFEDSHWEAIASNQVTLAMSDAQTLSNDALEAGLSLNFLTSLSIARKS